MMYIHTAYQQIILRDEASRCGTVDTSPQQHVKGMKPGGVEQNQNRPMKEIWVKKRKARTEHARNG
jgi:hypothetical protein